jgi:hypothetical protein
MDKAVHKPSASGPVTAASIVASRKRSLNCRFTSTTSSLSNTAAPPSSRTWIHLLQINRADAVAVRRLLMQEGVFQPDPTAN